MKTCSFLHVLFTETIKVHIVENLFKKAYGEFFFIEKTCLRQFQCVPTTNATVNIENYFEIYTYQVSCPLPLPLKHLKLQISIKISVTIPHIVYICMTAISPNLIT